MIVVVNPYTIHPDDKLYHRKYDKEKAEKLFLRIFRTRPEGVPIIDPAGTEGQTPREEGDEDEVELSFVKGIREKIRDFLDNVEG